MSTNTQALIRQLNTLAQSAAQLPTEQLNTILLDTCAYLLEEAAGNRKPLDGMNPAERSELFGCYTLISEYVDGFADDARKHLGIDATRSIHQNTMANLQILTGEKTRLENEIQNCRKDILQITTDIGNLNTQVTDAENELSDLNGIFTDLKTREAACTPQIIDAQKLTNRILETQVQQQEQELDAARTENNALTGKLNELKGAIAGVPDEAKALMEEYDRLDTKLKRLQTATVDCSYDKQKQLQDQIYELEPKARGLEEEYNKLKCIKETMDEAYIHYESQNQQFKTDILEKIEQHMDELNRLLPQHLDSLRQIKDRSRQMQEALQEAKALRDGYRAWFDQDTTPLDAWISAVGEPEFANLSQKLDLLERQRVQMLKKRIEDALKELDQLIKLCNDAISQDQSIVEEQALGRRK